jgi:hypothetical protein
MKLCTVDYCADKLSIPDYTTQKGIENWQVGYLSSLLFVTQRIKPVQGNWSLIFNTSLGLDIHDMEKKTPLGEGVEGDKWQLEANRSPTFPYVPVMSSQS